MAAPARGTNARAGALKAMNQYFELLSMGNMEIAGDMWLPEALERSSRFGIQYTGIPLRVDCTSPVIRDLDVMKSFLDQPIRNYECFPNSDWCKFNFSKAVDTKSVNYTYWSKKIGDWSWLGYPQDYYSADWPVTESKYFRVHVDPAVGDFINGIVLSEADRFVERVSDTLGISGSIRKQIARQKIEYFYCGSDSVVGEITGHRAKGILDLASNDVISATFPHFHEVVHLLANIRLQELPLFTLPIMREGFAVRYGGRWGKSNCALMDLGVFLLDEELISLDSILTMRGFESESSADIVYPVAGVFSAFLVDELGLDKYFLLYLRLSGRFDEVDSLTSDDVKAAIAEMAGREWEEVSVDFMAFRNERTDKHLVALPGGLEKGKVIVQSDDFVVSKDKHWIAFEFTPDSAEGPPSGGFLFAPVDGFAGQKSLLYQEQFPGEQFDGYRFGVVYDQNEAGLYDYATNQLMAKFIWGLSPSDNYFDADANKITIKFRKDLLNKQLPRKNEYKLLSL